ncbi:MAG: RNA polymerase sigma factor [Sulfuriferula sp.]
MSHWDSLSDQEIISDCLKGNIHAYAELVRRHQRMVFNVLYRFLGNYEASQDISQETFITAYQKLYMFNGRSKFSTWLCQVALNKARDMLRGQGIESLCDDLEDHQEGLAGSDRDTPHFQFEMSQENERVQQVLNKMPAHYREVLLLKHLEGFSNEEIVGLLNTTIENIKVRTFRARQMFKQIYEELV